MGHIHLGVLPKTLPWKRVVSLLDEGAADDNVVAESARAAEKELTSAAQDPVYVEAVRILLTVPLCAQVRRLRRCPTSIADIPAPDRPGLLDLIGATTRRLDEVRLEKLPPERSR
jgi:hypothetical protein